MKCFNKLLVICIKVKILPSKDEENNSRTLKFNNQMNLITEEFYSLITFSVQINFMQLLA